MLKSGHAALPPVEGDARAEYIGRYTDFFQNSTLQGTRILVYQHSAVGRDMLVETLERLGASVVAVGRSEEFVPIDTENINAAQLATIQALTDEAVSRHGPVFAVVSTDGDSDRPLILGPDPPGGSKVRFFGGDLVGMVVAEYLGADSVVVPISSNDGIDRGVLAAVAEPKTRIGSPFVIAGMEAARAKGRKIVCGWEANGGFLTGSDIVKNGNALEALPTRDALLPILSVLFAAHERDISVCELFARLPRRFSRAGLLKRFPQSTGRKIVLRFQPDGPAVRAGLAEFFSAALGFGPIERIDSTDGVRIIFGNGDVAHIRPSGNADELRIYAVADTQDRADEIVRLGVAEPDGILRRMESAVNAGRADAAG